MTLPVASNQVVRQYAGRTVRRHVAPMSRMLGLYAIGAVAELIPAWAIGELINLASAGALNAHAVVHYVAWIAAASLAGAGLDLFSRRATYVFGETIFAELREDFLASVLALPLAEVERAGTGDLLSRTTNDMDALSRTVRFAVPEWLVAILQALLTAGAALLISPLASLGALVSLPILIASTRHYLRYAAPGYRRERMSYAATSGYFAETIDGARTVEALRLGDRQRRRAHAHVRESFYSEMYTLLMRVIWFPLVEGAFALAVGCTLVWSGWLALNGHITVGAATTVTLYVVQLNDPLDRIISWLDELQVGQTALARLVGVSVVPDDRPERGPAPAGDDLVMRDVHYSYRPSHEVLRGVDLHVRPGERLAIVGPSGAGKSTIGRLLAGIDRPQRGSVRLGGVELADLPVADLRRHVALVTQEHHVFIGTVRDNLTLARPGADDDALLDALASVDAGEWVDGLPRGLDTVLGAEGVALTPAQAQQVALARLVLADPEILVLDEATALLDPRAARHLERSLSAVLSGRTVVAIAHRLHTAHDADRVAVVIDGRVAEIGTHDELVAHGGEYAALWHSWRNDGAGGS